MKIFQAPDKKSPVVILVDEVSTIDQEKLWAIFKKDFDNYLNETESELVIFIPELYQYCDLRDVDLFVEESIYQPIIQALIQNFNNEKPNYEIRNEAEFIAQFKPIPSLVDSEEKNLEQDNFYSQDFFSEPVSEEDTQDTYHEKISFKNLIINAFNPNNIDAGSHKSILRLLVKKYDFRFANEIIEHSEDKLLQKIKLALNVGTKNNSAIDLKQRYVDQFGVAEYLFLEFKIYKKYYEEMLIVDERLIDTVFKKEHEVVQAKSVDLDKNHHELTLDEKELRNRLRRKFRADLVQELIRDKNYHRLYTPHHVYMRGLKQKKGKNVPLNNHEFSKIPTSGIMNLFVNDGITPSQNTAVKSEIKKPSVYESGLGFTDPMNTVSFSLDLGIIASFAASHASHGNIIQLFELNEVIPTTLFKPALKFKQPSQLCYELKDAWYDEATKKILKNENNQYFEFMPAGSWKKLNDDSELKIQNVAPPAGTVYCHCFLSPDGYYFEHIFQVSPDINVEKLTEDFESYDFVDQKMLDAYDINKLLKHLVKSPLSPYPNYGEAELFVGDTSLNQHMADIHCSFASDENFTICKIDKVDLNPQFQFKKASEYWDLFIKTQNPQFFFLFAALQLSVSAQTFQLVFDKQKIFYFIDSKQVFEGALLTENNKACLPFKDSLTQIPNNDSFESNQFKDEYALARSRELRPKVKNIVNTDLTTVNPSFFQKAELYHLNLMGRKDLRDKKFIDADIKYVNFTASDLSQASFKGSSLFYVTFHKTNVSVEQVLKEAKNIDLFTLKSLRKEAKNDETKSLIDKKINELKSDAKESSAAVKIQKLYRGHVVRSTFFDKKDKLETTQESATLAKKKR